MVTSLPFGYYKSTSNTGIHVGHLWSSNGTLLASVTFSGESTVGWQQQALDSPVAITPNATYIASYYAPAGHYSINDGYFATSGVTNFPLRAPANNGESGPNGVYRGESSGFPTNTYSAANYWVDVVFATSVGTDTNAPVIISQVPVPGTVITLTSITVTFSKLVTGVDPNDLRINGAPATSVTGSGGTYTFAFTQPAAGLVTISWASAHGISDLASPPNGFDETAASATWQYTLVDVTAPVVSNLFPAAGATVAALSQIEVIFSEAVQGVDAGDLLINGQPATNMTHASGGPYVFTFPQPSTGAVSLAWAVPQGIMDIAAPPNSFAGGTWSYVLDTNLPVSDLVINELLVSNVSTDGLADEDGEQQDWIEIYNRGTNSVSLANCSLSDDPEMPGLWTFPARTIGPGQYLVVFASGKDRRPTNNLANLHTNFKLAVEGEHLGLYTPDSPRMLASGFSSYPEQRNDISYGLDTSNAPRYFTTPTPGAPNGNSTIIGVCEPVHVNVKRGFFTTPFDLIISCPTPGVTFRYTTDGSPPTSTSQVFPATLRVSDTTLFRGAAFKTNYLPSRTLTETYFFNLPAAYRSLPAISIVTATNNLWGPTGILGIQGGYFDSSGLWIATSPSDYHNPSKTGLAWERPTSMEWLDPANNSGFQVDCGIRVHASDWYRPRTTPTSKVSFTISFRSDYGPGRLDYPLFPLTTVQSFDQIVLRGGQDDQSNPFIRDELNRRLSDDMGEVAVHGNLAILFVNGVPHTNSFWYNPCERVQAKFFQEHVGGSPDWDVVGPPWTSGGGVFNGSFDDFQQMVDYVNYNNVTITSVYSNISRWLDLTNFADYVMLNAFAAMGDWPLNNWRAGRERTTAGTWRFVVWDAEYGLGNFNRSTNLNTFTMSGTTDVDQGLATSWDGYDQICRLYNNLKRSSEFKLLWADRVQKHFFNGGALTGANITNRFVELRNQLSRAITDMDTSLLKWTRDRRTIFFTQMQGQELLALLGAPSLSQFGGCVPAGFSLTMTHTNSSGSIYYTTDGSDPRVAFTGTISPSATAYTSAVPINASVTVKARVRKSNSVWSALTEAAFTYTSLGSPLRITEIMYNPPGGSVYEFIEVQNTSASSVDLSGCYFSGITYVFDLGAALGPGARLVLGNNSSTNDWDARYPGVTAFGWYSGNLNNGGERIELLDSSGNLITSVDYSNGSGWPKAADGLGYSLEVINPNGDPDNPANWLSGAQPNGTPGAANSFPPAQPVYLNEVMADNQTAVNNGGTYPDWIELFNPGSNAVSIANWSLTDSGSQRKYVFPGGTTVPAEGFLVVWCDSTTNTTPGVHSGFELSRDGEAVYLYDANTNRVDALGFGLQLADYSVGRVGGLWTLTTPTPNAANVAATLASVANLAINEWMANPVAGQSDWLELFNRSATAPVFLQGLYLATSDDLFQLRALSFLPPRGYVQLLADNGVGPTHLDFHLSAAGDRIALYDNTGGFLEQVTFGAQSEGVSSGRLPDGTSGITGFPGTPSPGTTNYAATYAGPVLNEVLAHNSSVPVNGLIQDFIELHNPGSSPFDLGAMSLSVDTPDPGKWVFPSGTILAAGAHLLIPCDGSRPASTNSSNFNLGDSLKGQSGGAYLFNVSGQLVNSVQYGPQIENLSIGLSGGQWKLLTTPTPGLANSAPATLGTNLSLRINEWLSVPATGADWFELYNTSTQAVDLSTISLSDDPSSAGVEQFLPAPLSFIGGHGFVQWIADASPGQGLNHVNFGLDGDGESLLLYGLVGTNYSLVDAIAFGAQQTGVSAGRLPDGAATIVSFSGSATPAASNYRLLQNVWINEVLTHTDPPFEDAIEFFNPTAAQVDISGWYLSDSTDNLRKYQVPSATIIPANGYATFYQYQLNPNPTNGFSFSSTYGDEVWLSAADTNGNETGDRLVARFGAAFNGESFGRVATSVGVDYWRVAHPAFGVSNPATLAEFRTGTGAPNAAPIIGPVVISEILYHPPGGTNGSNEYVELYNNSTNTVPLYDPSYPTNHWNLGDGLSFAFPTDVSLAPGGFLVVVDFDPTNTTALTSFRSLYGISLSIPIYGPFSGQLNNDGDSVGLYQPDTPSLPSDPEPGFVPYVLVDYVSYMDTAPWPTGAVDSGGLSLQRAGPSSYGNEPLNWVAALPTPGRGFGSVTNQPPVANNQSVTNAEDTPFTITLTGSDADGPLMNFVVVTNPAHGTLTGTAPNLTYTPATNYFGPDSLMFRVNDGLLTSAVATVSITITKVNHAPTATPDTLTRCFSQGVTAKVALLLTNDSDIDGDALNLVSVTNPIPFGATVTQTNDSVTYWPPFGNTNAGSFNYILSDNHGGYATGLVAVVVIADPAGSDVLSITAEAGSAVTVKLVGIPDFTYTVQFTDSLTPLNWQSLTTATANNAGEIIVRDPLPAGSTNRFYRAVRGIAPVKHAPTATPDTLTRCFSQGVTAKVALLLTNDSDIDGDALSLVSVTNPIPFGATVTQTNDSVTYWPPFGNTNAGSFNYILSDNHGGYATGLVTVVVIADPAGSDVLSIAAEAGSAVTVKLIAIPDFTYTVQFTDSLTPLNWQSLTTVTANNAGEIVVGDPLPAGSTNRFYRAVRGIAP